MADDYVQVQPDSSGKKVKTFTAVDLNGNTVEIQGIIIIDKDGFSFDVEHNETKQLLRNILREMQALRKIMGRATGQHIVALDAMTDDIG